MRANWGAVMSDELNPYASPRTPAEARAAVVRMPVRPRLTRLLTVGLIVNILSIPVAIGMEEVSGRLRNGGFPFLGNAVEYAAHAVSFWVLVAWPIVSLVAAIYTPVVDMDTKWWRTKTSIAAVMLLLWIALFATFFLIVSHWEQ